jgi:signal transduction histidine kinase
LSLASAFIVVSSLCAAGVAAGLLFGLSVQLQRGRADALLALFCAALLVWGLVNLLTLPNRPQTAASAMTLTAFFYFLFANRQIRAENTFISLLTLVAPVILIANLLIIWAANGITGVDQPTVDGAGSVVFILTTVYAAAAFWAILISGDARASRLRVGGLIFIAGSISPLLFSEWLYSVAPLVTAAAAALIGWAVVSAQMRAPVDQLQEEMRIANRDLRQATSEAASQKARNEVLEQQLQAAGQYRSDFLDNLGHKLRTPLNSIAGYTELLQSGIYGDLNDKQVDRLGKIQRNGETLLDLINNMLDLNKINAGRLELNQTTFEVNMLVDQVLSRTEPRREECGLKLEATVPPDLPPIHGDQFRLCQVLTQLVDNALKFTLEGQIAIQSQAIHVNGGVSPDFPLPFKGWLGDGEWVIIEVIDTGIGIAPEDQAKIFDEFYQVADPRFEEVIGTGLGLTIAKRLVELHEGVLWLRSIPDQGSTFYLGLRSHRR